MMILAVDPGPVETGWLILDYDKPTHFKKEPTSDFIQWLDSILTDWNFDAVVVEHFQSFGMPVGKETFETCYWIGEMRYICNREDVEFVPVYRKQVCLHHCQSPKAKDSNIRQAMIDRFGAPGAKKNPGATYGISKDIWSALAIAAYAQDVLIGATND